MEEGLEEQTFSHLKMCMYILYRQLTQVGLCLRVFCFLSDYRFGNLKCTVTNAFTGTT